MKTVTDRHARTLAIYAHPNDAELACGGTLAKWSGEGSNVGLVVVCAGDKGRNENSAVELTKLRKQESASACKVLGVELVDFLELPDGSFENDSELRQQLTASIRNFKPNVVITHDPTSHILGEVYINHRDHRVVGNAVLDVVQSAVSNPAYPPAGDAHLVESLWLSATEKPNVAVDISPSLDLKTRAMCEHQSQIQDEASISEIVKSRAENDGRLNKLECAEVFRRLLLS